MESKRFGVYFEGTYVQHKNPIRVPKLFLFALYFLYAYVKVIGGIGTFLDASCAVSSPLIEPPPFFGPHKSFYFVLKNQQDVRNGLSCSLWRRKGTVRRL